MTATADPYDKILGLDIDGLSVHHVLEHINPKTTSQCESRIRESTTCLFLRQDLGRKEGGHNGGVWSHRR